MGNIIPFIGTNYREFESRKQGMTLTITSPTTEVVFSQKEESQNGIVKTCSYSEEYHNTTTGEHQCHTWNLTPHQPPPRDHFASSTSKK